MRRETTVVRIPEELLPRDGRFGSGPSKVRTELLDALARSGDHYLGTSHRRPVVREVVAQIRAGLADLFSLPEGYEVVLGNGGSSAFFDIASFCLIESKSQHCSFGEFSERFAAAVQAAPHLEDPDRLVSRAGTHPDPVRDEAIDCYALTHNETSTGVMMAVERPRSPGGERASGLVVVDATSAAGGLRVDPKEFDAYFFAPQKCFGGDGGLWISLLSPAALDRAASIKASGRFVPGFLDLSLAIESSRKDQTYNTPALATLFMLAGQIEWFNNNGGLPFATGRSDRSAEVIYSWATRASFADPFVTSPADRSRVVATIDFSEDVDAARLATVLRDHGVLDIEPYRKLGTNQLRIALFPSIDPSDVEALTACIDYVVEAIS